MNYHDRFIYDPVKGDLIWKDRPRSEYLTAHAYGIARSRYFGRVVGSKKRRPDGRKMYVVANVDKNLLYAHRIIWEMHNGPIPDGMRVDHENTDEWDNRLENLRLATASQNTMNANWNKGSTGHRGVGIDTRRGGYRCCIQVNGKHIYLGRFKELGDAIEARMNAEAKYFGEFACVAPV